MFKKAIAKRGAKPNNNNNTPKQQPQQVLEEDSKNEAFSINNNNNNYDDGYTESADAIKFEEKTVEEEFETKDSNELKTRKPRKREEASGWDAHHDLARETFAKKREKHQKINELRILEEKEKKRRRKQMREEISELEEVVFGNETLKEKLELRAEDDDLFGNKKGATITSAGFAQLPGELAPAWRDEDDNEDREAAQRRVFTQLKQASWATLPDKASEEEVDVNEISRSTKNIVVTKGRLPKGFIDVIPLRGRMNGLKSVKSVNFHPNAQLVMAGCASRQIKIVQIDGDKNPVVQNINVPEINLHTAAFTPSGDQILVTGRKPYFYVLDVERGTSNKIKIAGTTERSFELFDISPDNKTIAFAGHNGYIRLVSNDSKRWISDLKMNGTVETLQFSADANYLYSSGAEGKVYIWDVRTNRCLKTFKDQGSSNTTVLGLSRDAQYTATGSTSGVVNVYNNEELLASKSFAPTPLKSIMNLTTKVDTVKFNHDSQLLAIASSNAEKASMRLIHLPSFTAYANFPMMRAGETNSAKTMQGSVNCIDFSPNSGYLAIGTKTLQLFRLSFFHDA